jgi:GNAT superfamily N-acetyltransferase
MLHRTKNAVPRPTRVRLGDGTFCIIRAIGSGDKAVLLNCFEGLSATSRRMRFFTAKPSLTEDDLAFLTGADRRDHIALAAIRLNDRGEETESLGAARCIRFRDQSEVAEFAIAVVDAAHRTGVGRALMTHLSEAAWEQGVRVFRCEVLSENEAMRALATSLGSTVRWVDGGTLEYDYRLPSPRVADTSPILLDPIAAAKLGLHAWSSGVERLLDASLDLCQTAVGQWFDSWPVRSSLPFNLQGRR